MQRTGGLPREKGFLRGGRGQAGACRRFGCCRAGAVLEIFLVVFMFAHELLPRFCSVRIGQEALRQNLWQDFGGKVVTRFLELASPSSARGTGPVLRRPGFDCESPHVRSRQHN